MSIEVFDLNCYFRYTETKLQLFHEEVLVPEFSIDDAK